jgi:hypothetical protein
MLKLMPATHSQPSMSVKQAAAALDRSESWVRDHLVTGLLERDEGHTGLTMVTAASVAWAKSLDRPRPRRGLRLVIDNTARRRN